MRLLGFALLLIVCAQGAVADELDRSWDTANRLTPLSTPAGKSAGTGFVSEFTVEAGDADSKANLTVTRLLSHGDSGQYFRYQLRASAPFDRKKADQVDVGSLSGLTAGTSVAFDISRMHWPKSELEMTTYEKQCQTAISTLIPGYTWKDTAAGLVAEQSTVVLCSKGALTEANLKTAIKGINKLIESCKKGKPSPIACAQFPADRQPPSLAPDFKDRIKEVRSSLEQAIDFSIKPISLWTLSAAANQQKFSYVLESAPTEKVDTSERGWSLTLAYTRIYGRWLWSTGFSRERSFKGGPTSQICNPFGDSGALQCADAATTAPQEKNKELLFAESRILFRDMDIAVSPRIEFDIDDSDWAIQVPAYLARNEKGLFTGGIKLGWTSDDDEFGASVFVGRQFSLFD